MNFLQLFLMLLFPAIILWSQNKVALVKTIGPVVLCYAAGIFAGLFFPENVDIKTSDLLTQASVPLAIPLMLFSLDLKGWIRLAPTTILSFVFSLIAISCVTIVCSLFFSDLPELWKMSGMLVGVFTGGTPNMSAIGLSLDVSSETFIVLNTSDIILGSLYLLFLLSFGKRFFGLFLRPFEKTSGSVDEASLEAGHEPKDMLMAFALALVIVGVSAGMSFALFQKIELPVILLGLTALGMIASMKLSIRNLKGSFTLGEYFLYCFCIAIGSMTDLQKLADVNPRVLLYCALIFIGAVTMHFALCKLFKIDKDTAVITNVAAVYGPPFVPPVAKSLGNPEVIISGLTCGLVGYAVGNYLGLAVAYIVRALIS